MVGRQRPVSGNELQMAEKLLQSLRLRQPEIVKPIAGYSGDVPGKVYN